MTRKPIFYSEAVRTIADMTLRKRFDSFMGSEILTCLYGIPLEQTIEDVGNERLEILAWEATK